MEGDTTALRPASARPLSDTFTCTADCMKDLKYFWLAAHGVRDIECDSMPIFRKLKVCSVGNDYCQKLNPVIYISLVVIRERIICYWFELHWIFAYMTVGWCRKSQGLNGPAPKGVLMTDGWGWRAIPQHTLIPSLQGQYQGIIGFADSQDEILLRAHYDSAGFKSGQKSQNDKITVLHI